jgi:hypothetical protein
VIRVGTDALQPLLLGDGPQWLREALEEEVADLMARGLSRDRAIAELRWCPR